MTTRRGRQSRTTSSNVERVFREVHAGNIVQGFHLRQKRYEAAGMILSMLLIVTLYFLSPYSLVHSITVDGTSFLNDAFVEEKAGVSLNSRFYLSFPFPMEKRIEKIPVVQSAHVTWGRDHTIHIQIKDRQVIGYRYDSDQPVLLFADGSSAPLESGYLDIIAAVPVIHGFDDEEATRLLCTGLKDVDPEVISQISSISQYDLEYDNQAVCVLMRNGGTYIGDYYNLDLLNDFRQTYAAMNNKSDCLYGFSNEEKKTMFTMACPWNDSSEQEYWTNDDGSPRTNAQGQKIPKHYYTLEDGTPALDSNGNRIPIPIDENGNEKADADFQTHYEAGYYASGTLQLPDENG